MQLKSGRKWEVRSCDVCSTEYQFQRGTKSRFCSKECKSTFQRTLPDALPRPCPQCGLEFTPPRKTPNQKYCGHSCAMIANHHVVHAASQTPEAKEKQASKKRGAGEGKAYPKLGGRHAHRVIAERGLGRPLANGEVVRFKNGNRLDARPDNLEVFASKASFTSAIMTGRQVPVRSHCVNGHRLDAPEAVIETSNGARVCRICTREYSREYARNWRAKHRDTYNSARRDAYKRNPLSVNANNSRRRARLRNAEGEHTAEDIRQIFAVQKARCAYCRTKLRFARRSSWHVDHIFPLILGGRNDRANLQVLCSRCNLKKGALLPEIFARQIGLLV